jgi:hypothetical protein
MSEKPSWLKSSVQIAFQLGPGLGITGPLPIKLFPFISRIEAWLQFSMKIPGQISAEIECTAISLRWEAPP